MTDALGLLTIKEAAKMLCVHRSTINQMIKNGEFDLVNVRSRKLIRREDIMRHIKKPRIVLLALPKWMTEG